MHESGFASRFLRRGGRARDWAGSRGLTRQVQSGTCRAALEFTDARGLAQHRPRDRM